MTKEGFARLAFEARYNAEHGEGGWEAWAAAGETERAEWMPVGSLIENLIEGQSGAAAPAAEPAKVIVVTDDTGRDRRYAADEWQAEEAVDVLREGEVIVTYPQGTWRRATIEGSELDSVRPKAVRLQAALRQVVMADDGTPAEVLQHIARTELERSGWDEDDL